MSENTDPQPTGKMHVDEVDIDATLVRRLLAAQFPQWADLPLIPVYSGGTDNAIYRLGVDLSVRLPRIESATGQIDKEYAYPCPLLSFFPSFSQLQLNSNYLFSPLSLRSSSPPKPGHYSLLNYIDDQAVALTKCRLVYTLSWQPLGMGNAHYCAT